jgi:hypothetical protein
MPLSYLILNCYLTGLTLSENAIANMVESISGKDFLAHNLRSPPFMWVQHGFCMCTYTIRYLGRDSIHAIPCDESQHVTTWFCGWEAALLRLRSGPVNGEQNTLTVQSLTAADR